MVMLHHYSLLHIRFCTLFYRFIFFLSFLRFDHRRNLLFCLIVNQYLIKYRKRRWEYGFKEIVK